MLFAQNTYVVQDTVAWQKGHHTIRFGGGLTRPQDNLVNYRYFSLLQFQTVPDMLLGQAGTPYGLPFGNVIASLDAPGDWDRAWRVWDANAYFQDDYKVTPRLTLNLGLRYERMGDVSDAHNHMANFDMNAADPNPPAGGSYQGLIVDSGYNGSSPSIWSAEI